MTKLTRQHFPKYLQKFKELKGICVGGCIDPAVTLGTGIPGECVAHGHRNHLDHYHGWICVQHKYLIRMKLTMLHEMAHVLVGYGQPHGKEWKKRLVEIGGTFKSYSYSLGHGRMLIFPDFTYRSRVW